MLVLKEFIVLLVLTCLPNYIIAVDEECGAKLEYGSSGVVPWHVEIYTGANSNFRPQLLCGGTLISLELVVTAAHCFWVPGSEKALDASQVTVAVGKVRQELKNPRDKPKQQTSQVEILYTAENYTGDGAGSSPGDLALLKLHTPVKRSRWVWPVCLDKGQEPTGVQPTSVGEVPGWNIVRDWPAHMLQSVVMPVIQLDVCREHLRQMDSENMLTPDKICAGHVDNGTSLCSEDSGSGLVYNEGDGPGGVQRWVLRGVLGAPVRAQGENSCHFLMLFTMLSFHRNWIHGLFPEFFPHNKMQPINNVTEVSNEITIDNDIGENYKLNVRKEEDSTSSMSTTDEQQPIPDSCLVPFPSVSSTYTVLMDRNNTMKPGSSAPEETGLLIKCREGYKISNNYCVCQKGKWSNIQSCEKVCIIKNTLTVNIFCVHDKKCIESNNTVLSGATIQVRCKMYHKPLKDDYAETIKCQDGEFESEIPECKPICGEELQHAHPNAVSGQLADPDSFPWHVAIYENKNENPYYYICGGSIISTNWFVSAAHCFYANENEKLKNASLFNVAAGKRKREWTDRNDKEAQESKVLEIHIPKTYQGIHQSYHEDLALVQVETPFSFSRYVHAVCLDLKDEKQLNEKQTAPGVEGKVAGFGATSEDDGSLADELQMITLPIIDRDTCHTELQRHNFNNFYFSDKICVGYLNGTALCRGDSGGGLVVRHHDNRWHLRGVVSISPYNKNHSSCNSHTYGLLTKVFAYKDFLRDARNINPLTKKTSQMSVSGCLNPEFPENGIYVTKDFIKALPGAYVPHGTHLICYCTAGRIAIRETIYCQDDNTWSDSSDCVASDVSPEQNEGIAFSPSFDTPLMCELPEATDFVNYEVRGSRNFKYSKKNPPNETYGNMLGQNDYILWTCDAGSDPPQHTSTFCNNGKWSNDIKCLKRCQMLRYQTVEFTCYDVKKSIINCGETVSSNTVLIPSCKKGFSHPNISSYDVECDDGTFDDALPPECNRFIEVTTIRELPPPKILQPSPKPAKLPPVPLSPAPTPLLAPQTSQLPPWAFLPPVTTKPPPRLHAPLSPLLTPPPAPRPSSPPHPPPPPRTPPPPAYLSQPSYMSQSSPLPIYSTTTRRVPPPPPPPPPPSYPYSPPPPFKTDDFSTTRSSILTTTQKYYTRTTTRGTTITSTTTRGPTTTSTTTEGTDEMDEEKEGCVLPKFPDNGVYTISKVIKTNETSKEKEKKVPYDTVLFYRCSDGYKISHRLSKCTSEGIWSSSPICKENCKIRTSNTVDFICLDRKKSKIKCSEQVTDGTKVQTVCKKDHFSWNKLPNITCVDGDFDIEIPKCSPECGFYKNEGNVTKETRHTPPPWHVAVYQSRAPGQSFIIAGKIQQTLDYVCNGNLLTGNSVITAAKCFVNPATRKIYPFSLFRVAAGKVYTDWSHPNEIEGTFQTSEVQRFYTSKKLKILIMILKTLVTFSERVHPICLTLLTGEVTSMRADYNEQGKVTVWTQHESQDSEKLKELSLTVQNSEQCEMKNSDVKKNENSGCAKSSHNATVCKSVIGSGLAFLHPGPDGLQKRWFLHYVITDVVTSGSSKCGQLSVAHLNTVIESSISPIFLHY